MPDLGTKLVSAGGSSSRLGGALTTIGAAAVGGSLISFTPWALSTPCLTGLFAELSGRDDDDGGDTVADDESEAEEEPSAALATRRGAWVLAARVAGNVAGR